MRKIVAYVERYYATTFNPWAYLSISLILAAAVWVNYTYIFETNYVAQPPGSLAAVGRYILFYASAFVTAFLVQAAFTRRQTFLSDRRFWLLCLYAVTIFAFREFEWVPLVGLDDIGPYWHRILRVAGNWVVAGTALYAYWRWTRIPGESLYGLTAKDVNLKPYWVMLGLMVPLITIASYQPDFLVTYPRGGSFPEGTGAGFILLYELFYGFDFLFIELFFRGFLVFAFAKICGRDVILPMAAFYVFIHFEKPMGEAISSYFGGFLLGIIAYESKSIYGGIIVHIGIAWMMEIAAHLQKA